ncbi:MAG: hypothetical protein AAF564_02565, partial [Bacteroidota bacterium]
WMTVEMQINPLDQVANMQDQTEWIVNVHGTFAAHEDDAGEAWWQWGSDFSKTLQAHLPGHVQFLPADHTFHWSGKNSEREREQAARDLLTLLEGIDRPFHVIAHSHGGSVLWRALQLSLFKSVTKPPGHADRQGLTNLKSWTTIGTPFLDIKPQAIEVNLFTLLYRFAAILAYLLFFAAAGYIAYVLLGLIPALAWPFTKGWLIAALVTLPVSLLLMLVGVGNAAGFLEAMMLEIGKPLQRWTSRVYAGRWLPLWSEHDEALLAIRAARKMKGEFAPRIEPVKAVFGTDVLLRIFRWPSEKLWMPVYNRFLAPRGDRAFLSILQKFSSGNDLPGTLVRRVTAGPAPLLDSPPSLSPSIQTELVDNANAALLKVMPQVRPLLGGLAAGQMLLKQDHDPGLLSGDEMVHTTYYRHAEIIKLIGDYIRRTTPGDAIGVGAVDPWLAQMEHWKQTSLKTIQDHPGDPGGWTLYRWMGKVLSEGQVVQGFYNAMPVPGLLRLAKIALALADMYERNKSKDG